MQQQLETWVHQAKKGDQQAFYQLYHQFKGRVYAICLRLLADRGQAEDATQEAFVRAYPVFVVTAVFQPGCIASVAEQPLISGVKTR